MFAGLEWDTWVTIGDDYDSSPSEIGTLNLNGLLSNSWSFGESGDASIYYTPDNPNCLADDNNYVLLGQFTTDGVLSGNLNIELLPDGSIITEKNIESFYLYTGSKKINNDIVNLYCTISGPLIFLSLYFIV